MLKTNISPRAQHLQMTLHYTRYLKPYIRNKYVHRLACDILKTLSSLLVHEDMYDNITLDYYLSSVKLEYRSNSTPKSTERDIMNKRLYSH